MTGRFHPSVYERFHGDYAKGQQEHYVGSASVYVDLDLQSVDPYCLTEDDEFLNRVQRINTVCFRGCEGVKDAKDQISKNIFDKSPIVRGAAIWALNQITDGEELKKIREISLSKEKNQDVIKEWIN